MNSRKKFRRNRKKNKTRNKRGGGPEEDAELFDAVKKQGTTADQINAILNKGANVNARNVIQSTPLHVACVMDHMELAMALVDRGADVDARNVEQDTPLHNACYSGNMELIMALLNRGADVNASDRYGYTPLHKALMNGHAEVAMALLNRGADVDANNKEGKTPLEIAKETIDKEKLRNAAAEYKKNKDLLFAAVKKQGTTADQINAILDKGAYVNARDAYQKTPLHYACNKRGDIELAMALVDRGADVDARDVNQRTPLHAACGNGLVEVAMALVDRGADVDAKNENQKTPIESLMISNRDKAALRNAAAKYKENIVELFAAVKKEGTTADQINAILDNGAYVNARDVNQVTPLHYASINGNMEVVMALVDRGADIHAKNTNNKTPLDVAEETINKEALRNAAAKYKENSEEPNNAINNQLFDAVKEDKTTAADINAILDRGADINARDMNQFTPLFWASMINNVKVAMALIERGADVNVINVDQRTPLHYTCMTGNMELTMALIEKGADIHARDIGQNTPLHYACMKSILPKELIMALIDKGADINANNKEGKTPLQLIKKPEDRKKIEEYAKPKRNFITTKKQWKIYLDDEHAEQFENLNGKYEVEFVDGTIYEGEWKDNNKHGKGKEIHPNGDKYEGIWENDKLKDGKVKKTYDNGHMYQGEWRMDKRHGRGVMKFSSGNVYDGEYVEGNRHGTGKMTFANGNMYEGEFKDDMKHGKGKFTYANGDVYEGDYADDEAHGKGKITYHEGDVYEGDWKDGNYNGNGKMTYKDGTIYEGGWKDGGKDGKGKLIYKGKKPIDVVYETDDENYEYLISGEGTFFNITLKDDVEYQEFNGKIEDSKGTGSGKREYADGIEYEGDYQDGKMHGKGKFTYANGDVYEGDWKDDVKDGKGKMTYADGHVYEGDYKDDKRSGKGKCTWANGDKFEGDYQDDKRNGTGKYTWANGDMYEGDFVKNKRHGKGEFKYVNGNFYKGESKDGKKDGYGLMKYETAKHQGMIPAGSTYDGYWKNDKMHTRDTQLGKLTWAPNDKPEYPDRSTPCGLRSFEGKWNNDNPKISREYDDFPMSLENWGNYTWEKGDSVLLDRRTAYAYEVHQKGKKMQKKLGPVLDFMEEEQDHASSWSISDYLKEGPQQFIEVLNAHGEDFLNHLFENEDERRRKSTSLHLILDKLSTSDYVRNRDTKRIIAICFYYVLGELKSIEEGVEKAHFDGVKHEPDFQLYYINTFIEDNIAAYNGSNGMSCTQGIFERFFTVLESTLALAVAPGNDSFLGKDEATIQERREKYNKILDLWGRNKPKMEDILASFDAIDDRSMVKDKSQDEKIRVVMNFIKSKYISADQDTSSVEKDFDDYLKAKNIPRDFLFAGDPDYIIGGKRKKTRKYRKKGRKTRRKNKK